MGPLVNKGTYRGNLRIEKDGDIYHFSELIDLSETFYEYWRTFTDRLND